MQRLIQKVFMYTFLWLHAPTVPGAGVSFCVELFQGSGPDCCVFSWFASLQPDFCNLAYVCNGLGWVVQPGQQRARYIVLHRMTCGCCEESFVLPGGGDGVGSLSSARGMKGSMTMGETRDDQHGILI